MLALQDALAQSEAAAAGLTVVEEEEGDRWTQGMVLADDDEVEVRYG